MKKAIIAIILLFMANTAFAPRPVAQAACYRGTLQSNPPETIYYTSSGKMCTYPSTRAKCYDWR